MQTGDRIKWVIDGDIREGIFMQNLNGKSQVMCTSFNGVPMAVKCEVETRLLILI